MARTLVYAATWHRYQSWCEEHDVAPCGTIVQWANTDRDLQGSFQAKILLVDPPPAEFLEGIQLRHLEVIAELPKAEIRPGLFVERAERDSYNLRVSKLGPLWYAKCIGTSHLDWPMNPGRWGFTKDQALARATLQARRRDAKQRRGEKVSIPRDC